MTQEEVLGEINKLIREEHGSSVKLGSKLYDSGIDSFGFNMVVLELDNKYKCFDKEWSKDNLNGELLVQTMVDRIINESK